MAQIKKVTSDLVVEEMGERTNYAKAIIREKLVSKVSHIIWISCVAVFACRMRDACKRGDFVG